LGNYFGTDGIRGEVGKNLTLKMAYAIGQSLKTVFNPTTIVIGKDTRESSELLAKHIASGAMAKGIDVIDAGVVSTPMIAYYAKAHQMIGIMITASHNPYHDNGIKLFNKGLKLTHEEELNIEAYFTKDLFESASPYGSYTVSDTVSEAYITYIQTLPLLKTHQIVLFDSANGANVHVSQRLMSHYTKSYTQVGNTPNGKNINFNCGSTHLDYLQNHINETYDVGFSFDGDGDRVLMMDAQGKVYDGDMIIYLIAKYLKSQDALTHNTVVLTKMSNPGIIKALNDEGIKVVKTDVGDKYVQAEMAASGYVLGGENSGHIIYSDFLSTGDGLLIALLLLTILETEGKSLKALTENIAMYPQKMVNIKNVDKAVLNHTTVKALIDEVKTTFKEDCLVLVRPSGTEPLIRVTLSHKDEQLLDQKMDALVQTIKTLGDV